ncbi:MAG: hypothetical protein K6E10_09225 [Eubacterium sp.]|nr:hypothetical protein [Eubacterium sp.]
MKELIDALKNMDTSTLVILGFALVLLIFLLVLIIVTIKVLRTNYEIEEDEEKTGKPVLLDDEEEKDEDEDEDETSKLVREAVESVEVVKAKMEAEKIAKEAEVAAKMADDEARKNAAERAKAIADSVRGNSSDDEGEEDQDLDHDLDQEDYDSDEDSEDYDEDFDEDFNDTVKKSGPDDVTGELDTTKIRNALKQARAEAEEDGEDFNSRARMRAEAPEYNASFDSAFVDRPAYEEKIEPVIPNPTPESILNGQGAGVAAGQGMSADQAEEQGPIAQDSLGQGLNMGGLPHEDKITVNPANVVPEATEEEKTEVKEFLEENPKPEKKKRKVKKKDKVFEEKFGSTDGEIKVADYFWYNTQDIEGLARKEDMYFKCHYFNSPESVVPEIVTEMYDCGFVRTEELQRIAYGITFRSLGMKEILKSEEKLGFNKDKAVKEPTESDRAEAYDKWCQYVDNFKEILVIKAPDEVKDYIMNQVYEYGHKDVEELMYSPF